MGDYMLDFSNDDLESGKELTAANEGEYRLRLKDWKTDDDGKIKKFTEDDKPFIMPVFEVINCEEADHTKDINHFLWLVDDWMDAKQKNNARFALREFWTALGIDYRMPIDPESAIGAECDALLIVQEDQGYGEQNRIKRFIVSH